MKRTPIFALVLASLACAAERIPDSVMEPLRSQLQEGIALDSLANVRESEVKTLRIQAEAIGYAAIRQARRSLKLEDADTLDYFKGTYSKAKKAK